MAKGEKKGHPNFRHAVGQVIYEIRESMKVDAVKDLEEIGEQLIKVAKEELAFRNKATPVIDRLSVGKGKPRK